MEETLQVFLNSIEAQSWAEVNALAGSVAADHEEKTAQVRAQAERAAEGRRQAELSGIAQTERLTTDARSAENRRELLRVREACSEEAAAALRERIGEFTASDAYSAHLVFLLEKGLAVLGTGAGHVTAYLRREDMSFADGLRKKARGSGLSVAEGDFSLGGIILESADLGRRADMSFDTGFEAARDSFGEIFGLEIV